MYPAICAFGREDDDGVVVAVEDGAWIPCVAGPLFMLFSKDSKFCGLDPAMAEVLLVIWSIAAKSCSCVLTVESFRSSSARIIIILSWMIGVRSRHPGAAVIRDCRIIDLIVSFFSDTGMLNSKRIVPESPIISLRLSS